jgi:replicative DNA helicase
VGDFVIELIKCCFTSPKIFDICKQHLKFHYLQNEAQKKVLRAVYDTYDATGKVPTIGIIGQSFIEDKDVIALLSQIKKVNILNEHHESILKQFESFIKRSRFIALYSKVGELFNQGKQEEATEELAKESAEIVAFQLKETYYTRVFQDFEKRNDERLANKDRKQAKFCTWGIHELDDRMRGIEYGRSALIMARSGGGKSTGMKWVGVSNARQGKRVVHFQAEGTERECLDGYDACWTSINLDEMETGNIPQTKAVKIKKTHRDILATGGEIFVYAAEQFDSLTIQDCREILIDIEKIYGEVDLVIFDYLEKFTLKGTFYNSEAGERKRRADLGDKITNIATEFDCAVITAIQANDIKATDYNKPDFIMTRNHISEFKAAINPFSYFITLNQTDEEYDNGICRLYIDKARRAKRGGKPVRIYQSMSNGRFYDAARTIENFYEVNAAA